MVLQQVHVASISKQVVIANQGSSKLGVLSSVPFFLIFDMFLVTRGNVSNT